MIAKPTIWLLLSMVFYCKFLIYSFITSGIRSGKLLEKIRSIIAFSDTLRYQLIDDINGQVRVINIKGSFSAESCLTQLQMVEVN